MDVRVLDLDGAVMAQCEFLEDAAPCLVPLRDWGPRIRMGCSLTAYNRFERSLGERLGITDRNLIFYGSGDFHHVTLALLRRLRQPFHLLVLDKHPDWMRGVPLMHCGTWLHHALQLPLLQRVFHLGGDLDFDNLYRFLAPWRQLKEGKIQVFPAVRRYTSGRWQGIAHEPLRTDDGTLVTSDRMEALLRQGRADLGRFPLYISLDKDVMLQRDAVVNWDSGHLQWSEVQTILSWFLDACGGNLIGMDVLGDWSPVRVHGWLRHLLHFTEHPRLRVNPAEASCINGRVNAALRENAPALLV